MNKFFKEFFTTSRNERIGFLCILAIMIITLCYSALTPCPTITDDTAKLAAEFQQAIDSSKVDTIKKKRKRKAKQDSTKTPAIITVNDLDYTDTFE